MTPEEIRRAEAELERMGPLASFPWHTQQEYALRAATDIVSVNGGNQSGKTFSGLGICSRLVRREGPIYRRLRQPEGRTIEIWVAPKTQEKYLSYWEPRLLDFVFKGMKYKYVSSPNPTFKWEDEWGGGVLRGKAQKQGFMAFESDAVDLIIFDEEPEDPRLISSAKARFSATNGVLVLCFTPLLGMSFTYHDYYQPTARPKFRIADRVWRRSNALTIVEMGMADNPSSVAGGGVERLLNDPSVSEAERAARLYGKYGYTEGLLFKMWAMLGLNDDDPYFLDDLPKNRSYTWVLTADPNKRHGALLTAFDSDGNRYYCAEHYKINLPDIKHAEHYKTDLLEPWQLSPGDVQTWADPGGAGAQAIINLAEGGIFATAVRKDAGSVSASIKRLRGAAFIDPSHRHPVTKEFGAPRVYFIRWNEYTRRGLNSEWTEGRTTYTESRLCYELRQYRQKEESPPDTPVKEKDDLVDTARYAEIARAIEPDQPSEDEKEKERSSLDAASREEAEAWDALETKAAAAFAEMQNSLGRQIEHERANPNDVAA